MSGKFIKVSDRGVRSDDAGWKLTSKVVMMQVLIYGEYLLKLDEIWVRLCEVQGTFKRAKTWEWVNALSFEGQRGTQTNLCVPILAKYSMVGALTLTYDYYWSFYEPCEAKIFFMPPVGPVQARLNHIRYTTYTLGALSSDRHVWDFPTETHTLFHHDAMFRIFRPVHSMSLIRPFAAFLTQTVKCGQSVKSTDAEVGPRNMVHQTALNGPLD